MSLTVDTQEIVNWSRNYIPDPLTRVKSVRGVEIGQTALPTGFRETFYIPHSPVGSVFLYVKPYKYSAVSTFIGAVTTDRSFVWNATLQSCQFPNGSSDASIRPEQYLPVLAEYEYTESKAYAFRDNELVEFLPEAISYLNNTYDFSFSYSGTISSFAPVFSSDDEQELIARALAIVVRKSYVEEQMQKGLGVRIRGPMQSIDSVAQMKEYNKNTLQLEKALEEKASRSAINNNGEVIDLYDETVI